MEYRMCPDCGSIVDVAYWDGDHCPICDSMGVPTNMVVIRDENGDFKGVEVD